MTRIGPLLGLPLLLLGCSGEQSVLAPRGAEASDTARLFWVMTGFLGLVLVGVVIAGWQAIAGGPRLRADRAGVLTPT